MDDQAKIKAGRETDGASPPRPEPGPGIARPVEHRPTPRGRHLWEYTAVRDAFWIATVVGVLWVGYYLSAIVTPILIALVLAYLVQPVVDFAHRRGRVPRALTIWLILAVMMLSGAGFAAWLAPKLVGQAVDLAVRLPGYLQSIADQLDMEVTELRTRLESAATEARSNQENYLLMAGRFLLGGAGPAADVIANLLGAGASLALSVALIPIFFVAFALKFPAIAAWPRPYIPASRRQRVLQVVAKMDGVVSTFIRVRVVIGFLMGVMFSVGWWMAGVPYWFLLGMGAGLLSLIPYACGIVWPLAIALKWLEVTTGAEATGFDWMSVLLWPSVVYIAVQMIESWGLTPVMQGQGLNLSPLTILVVVLIGGSLAGMYGLLLAVPMAACVKIVLVEVLLPRLREWSAGQ